MTELFATVHSVEHAADRCLSVVCLMRLCVLYQNGWS